MVKKSRMLHFLLRIHSRDVLTLSKECCWHSKSIRRIYIERTGRYNMKSDYETMHRVLERSRVLNDYIQELGLDMPPMPVALEELCAYRERREAEETYYREALDAPDLMLYDSYEAKHPAGMQEALASRANPDLRICWEGVSLMTDAILCGWPEGAEILLDAGASPVEDDAELLITLCCEGPSWLLKKALSLCDLPRDWRGGCDYMSLAAYAAAYGQVDCLRVLRECGMDLLAHDGKALCEACKNNRTEAVRYLVYDCDAPLEEEYDDRSPLFYAAIYDSLDCARILLETGANPLHEDIVGATPIKKAASDNMVMLLEDAKRKNRWLMPASRRHS